MTVFFHYRTARAAAYASRHFNKALVHSVLKSGEKVFVSIAPSFVANYDGAGIEAMEKALKHSFKNSVILDLLNLKEFSSPRKQRFAWFALVRR